MIKVLDKSKTLTTLVSDTSNGLGQLKVMNDLVTEELNGIYELEFDILTTEKHYDDLKNNMLVKVNVNEMDDEQIFRVYEIAPAINFVAHVRCQHISYDLSKIVVKPFTATGAVNIKNQLVSQILGSYPFSTWTDITNTTSTFTNDIPRPFRECLGGYEGSVLDVLRPEYEWDNLTVKLHARRGSDHNTRIAYGKNLTDFQQEENNESVYDAVYGYAVVDEVTYQASDIYNKTGASFPKVLNVDFSDRYESGDTPTSAELLNYATQYANNNDIEVPNVNIKISFVPLWQTEEYKNIAPLERVFLGDTVHVYFDKLNVEASSRVIKTVWSPSLKRYEEIELGSARANLNTVINDTVKEATEGIADSISVDTGYLEQQLDDLSSLIINGLGLYKTEEQVQGGGVRIILHNKPTLADSDTQYYMSAAGIMVSTDYGVTWNAGFDTQTGELYTQALSTIVLNALEIYGSFITFGDINGKYITASVFTDSNDVPQGVSFDGSGYARFQPQEAFIVNNITSSNDTLNYFEMGTESSENYIKLENYQYENGELANRIQLDSTPSTDTYTNTLSLQNYLQGGSILSNSLRMYSQPISMWEGNQIYLTNYKTTSEITANSLSMKCTSLENTVSITNYAHDSNSITVNSFGMSHRDDVGQPTLSLNNYQYSSGSATKANTLKFSGDLTATLWSKNDLRLRSAGAVRIYANLEETATTGDYNTNPNGSQQDVYVGGYSLKLQCQSGGRIYLYWGSQRYYLGVSNGVVTATSA